MYKGEDPHTTEVPSLPAGFPGIPLLTVRRSVHFLLYARSRFLGGRWVCLSIRNLSNDNHSRFHVERLRQLKWFPVEEDAGRFLIHTGLVWPEDLNPRECFANTKLNIVSTRP